MGIHAAVSPAAALAAAQARAQAATASSPAAVLAAAQARAQAVAAAAAFAARLSAPSAAPSAAPAAAEGVAQVFDLNDLEPLARAALTKRPVHEDVTRKTGCVLHTRRVASRNSPQPWWLAIMGAALTRARVQRPILAAWLGAWAW
jgi:hypothetical protein